MLIKCAPECELRTISTEINQYCSYISDFLPRRCGGFSLVITHINGAGAVGVVMKKGVI